MQLDDVHGSHGQTGAVDQAADLTIETNVVEVGLRRFHVSPVFLALVLLGEDVLLSELGVVVDVYLAVHANDLTSDTPW